MKRTFNILFSILLTILIIFPNVSLAYSIKNDYSVTNIDKRIEKTQEVANKLLNSLGKNSKLNDLTLLKNLNGDTEAVLYSLDRKGYVIVNINDFSIPEFSLEGENPFNNIQYPIYNGPLNYYSKKDAKSVLNIKDSIIVNRNEFANIYSKKEISLDEKSLTIYKNFNTDIVPYGNLNTIKKLPGKLKAWYIDGGNCGAIASAITMRYYYDYVNKSYVNPSKISENSLISLMQKYVGYGGTGYSNLKNGLNRYFRDRGINNSVVSLNYFNYSRLENRIDRNRPVIVGTSNDAKYKNHWIIAHGYAEINYGVVENSNYIIVNDGWENNDVWVDIKSASFDGLIYFEK
ncbi:MULTISPECIES: cysteine peptidase family C39 domain-containing protein [Helcococcus]|uniref:Peptidase C39-like domain-containing protein n=1 Tax=Helcococcus bovis TaxID=3153252 RepID=A0ABW9F5U5_9FIRM